MAYGNLGKNSINRNLSETQKNVAYELAHQPFTKKSIDEISQEYGIVRSTIWRWKSLEEFNNEVLRVSKEIQRGHLHEFNSALYNCLNSRNEKTILKAIELYYKNQGLLKDVNETTIKEETDISIKDLLKEIEGL